MHHPKISLCHRKEEPEKSVLYIVGTPIGNLGDFSPRAINILNNVSIIACEDTRNTKKLLNHFTIKNKLISVNQNNIKEKIKFLIGELKKEKSIAIVSDAGMPLISDPGELLVKEAKKNNFDAICIPGPCAALAALVSSGCSCSKFTFYGFLPRSKKAKLEILNNINKSEYTSILYESPKRIINLLKDLEKICGKFRKVSLTKELTKIYEQHLGNSIDEVLKYFEECEPKGEFTLVIEGNEKKDIVEHNQLAIIKKDLEDLIEAGLSHSIASSYLSKKYNQPRNLVYNLIINKKRMYD